MLHRPDKPASRHNGSEAEFRREYGGAMSDGREEREEREKRRKQEEQEDREDRLNRNPQDEWEPERGGS
jgi:hypothetical protein